MKLLAGLSFSTLLGIAFVTASASSLMNLFAPSEFFLFFASTTAATDLSSSDAGNWSSAFDDNGNSSIVSERDLIGSAESSSHISTKLEGKTPTLPPSLPFHQPSSTSHMKSRF